MVEARACCVECISDLRELSFPGEWYGLASESHFWFQWRLAAVKRQLIDLGIDIQSPAKALDIGCGNGILTGQLEREGNWTIDGADLNMQALQQHTGGRGRILYYDILERDDRYLEAYDYLLIYDVLEHIEQAEAFLYAALEHLRPGGVMFIGVPACQWLFSQYDTAAGHFRRYGKRSLRAELMDMPVDILDCRYWGMAQVPLLMVRKFLLGMNRDASDIIARGFTPPGQWFNVLMGWLMRLEQAITPRPPIGSSLSLAVRKQ